MSAPRRNSQSNSNFFHNKQGELCEIIYADPARNNLQIVLKPEKGTYYAEYAYFKRVNGQNEQFKTKIVILPWIGGTKDKPWALLTAPEVIELVKNGWIAVTSKRGDAEVTTKYAFNSLTFEKQIIAPRIAGDKPGSCYKWAPARIWEDTVKVNMDGQNGARPFKVDVIINYRIVTETGVHFVIANQLPTFEAKIEGALKPCRFDLGLAGMTAIANAAGTFHKEASHANALLPLAKPGETPRVGNRFNIEEVHLQIDLEAMSDAVRINAEAEAEAERLYNEAKALPATAPDRYKKLNEFRKTAKVAPITYTAFIGRPGADSFDDCPAAVVWGKQGGVQHINRSLGLPFEFTPPSNKFAYFVHQGSYSINTGNAPKNFAPTTSADDWDDSDDSDDDLDHSAHANPAAPDAAPAYRAAPAERIAPAARTTAPAPKTGTAVADDDPPSF